ncbi:nitronate monooxygenase [Iamia majanohamensis]|uniref:Nitronate monooxygenase n=1 Tax=Iamia majanohamensis TaxID=467976 RepID=A0AAE9Y4Q2_9ACTN|nr:nitronate monooxygenase [Iamia majanohamensis]WCO66195.1 nitronate monooxygenase [Iamia majanohamensis]
MASALDTRICTLLGCRHPIVQTGMGWVSGANLTAATSAAGGFGILAAVTMDPDQLRRAVQAVKEATDAPFGVNFRADQPDLDERIRFVADEGVRLVSFAGAPAKDAIARLHDHGVLVMPTVGARRHAEKMLGWGVDAVIAQGGEGGGHTGTVPTSLLLPDVVDAVGADIPVLGAGGFHDGRGLVAALAYGADGIAMGTRFLLTAESRVPDAVKERYLVAKVTDTVVTEALDGAPQRVIRTDLVDRLIGSRAVSRLPRAVGNALAFRRLTGTSTRDLVTEGLAMRRNQDLTLSQLAMAANAPMLIKAALVDGHPEVGVLPTGQVTGLIDAIPSVADVVARIVAEAEATLARLEGGDGPTASGDSET